MFLSLLFKFILGFFLHPLIKVSYNLLLVLPRALHLPLYPLQLAHKLRLLRLLPLLSLLL